MKLNFFSIVKLTIKVMFNLESLLELHFVHASYCNSKFILLRFISRYFKLLMRNRYSSFISPKSNLSANVIFPHPIGIVIGDGVCIGDCVIYQNVTLGAKKRGYRKNGMNYPRLSDGVIIYAGAVVVGGVNLNSSCIIGANNYIDFDVEKNTVIYPHRNVEIK